MSEDSGPKEDLVSDKLVRHNIFFKIGLDSVLCHKFWPLEPLVITRIGRVGTLVRLAMCLGIDVDCRFGH
jgi:hypothetical protein